MYRAASDRTTSGYLYSIAYTGLDGRRKVVQRANEADALTEATTAAERLSKGRIEAAELTKSDWDELATVRRLASPTPAVHAMQQWHRAQELTDGHVIEAAEAWARLKAAGTTGDRRLSSVVGDFIRAKDKAGKQGERTYKSKLRPLVDWFGADREIDTLTADELGEYLHRFADGVTRNDHRKRAVALWRWAQANRRIPRGMQLEIELTERAAEKPTEIGILSTTTWERLLRWCHEKQARHLAALVLAGFCGLRADEIHGKRSDREKRQLWEDVHADRGFVRVTVAKTNTPSWRLVPLCPAAIAWLELCPGERTGPVCAAKALEDLRRLAKADNFDLPENCLRHSFISYRLPVVSNNKPQVASEAGNSVAQIDARYRVPLTEADGKAWFAVFPARPSPH